MEVVTFQHHLGSPGEPHTTLSRDSDHSLTILFGASTLINTPDEIHQAIKSFAPSPVVGCSTAGEIFGTQLYDDSLVGATIRFAHTTVKFATAPVHGSHDSYQAGESIGEQLNGPELGGVLVFSDGLHVNGSELVRELNAALPDTVIVTGGLAGDGERFQHTWVIVDGATHDRKVVGVGLYGSNLHVGHGSKGGFDIFGPERRVTRSQGNVLYELDGKPALELYKLYLGDRASGLPATGFFFPLALRDHSTVDKQLVRTLLAVDESTQSLTFAGDIPQGVSVQLMQANFDRLISGASQAALSTIAPSSSSAPSPTLAIAISCVGRRLVLGERTEEEIEATLDMLPPGTKQIGFYAYGEISPYATGHCDFHNQTMTLTTIFES